MDTVTLTSKFQIALPKDVRERMNLAVGQRLTILAVDGQIVLAPQSEAPSMRGFAAGIDTTVPRDDDRV